MRRCGTLSAQPAATGRKRSDHYQRTHDLALLTSRNHGPTGEQRASLALIWLLHWVRDN